MRQNIYDRYAEKLLRERQEQAAALQESEASPPPPAPYLTNELSFIRPVGVLDKTFHVFAETDSGPSPFSLVIGRSQIDKDADVEGISQRVIKEMEGSLAHLEWINPLAPLEIAGVEGHEFEYRWRQQGKPVHQIQILFLHTDEQHHRVLIQITGTSNNIQGMLIEERIRFYSVVETMQLRQPHSGVVCE
ncbi:MULTISPECIES: DcrB-related protein [unclassified Pseudomonas]|uniref:DcrB-related protein n=1 Tax=unclassified Pseudomonas TaxID=196821 RepID=UPI0030D7EC5E